MVSFRRLSTFLRAGELQPNAVKYEPPNGKLIMEITNGEFRWQAESPRATLEGIDVEVGPGGLVDPGGLVAVLGCWYGKDKLQTL